MKISPIEGGTRNDDDSPGLLRHTAEQWHDFFDQVWINRNNEVMQIVWAVYDPQGDLIVRMGDGMDFKYDDLSKSGYQRIT
jgi:hypothetical protein